MTTFLISLISTYGYLAVFIGSIFEGESILILGGFAVHEGYLAIVPLFIYAFLGAVVGDLSWFLLGKYKGHKIMNQWPRFKKWMGKPLKLIHAKPSFTAFSMRFMYGFRHIVPFSLGMSNLRVRTFLFWNMLGALAWILAAGITGLIFGDLLEYFLGNLKRIEFVAIVVAIIIIAGIQVVGRVAKYFIQKRLDLEDDNKI
jgi:membrane protein DedA with SNARE-associated domain